MLITFEGLDFSGKSTQAQRLANRLTREGFRVLVVREPGGTAIGERIRSVLLDKSFTGMTDTAELFLFSASRAQLVNDVIRPALNRGTVVVCDRFYDSTTAYQGWGRGLPPDAVQTVNNLATGGLQPSLTIFLDVPVDVLEARARAAGSGKDRMESNGHAFYDRVRRGYLALAQAENRFVVVRGDQSESELEVEIWNLVEPRIAGNVRLSRSEER
ncbi:MAG: dTMP kinase [Ignavibacteriales bacterium]|nr:dTMP kinase [Ignavibacteriales bacterium]